MPSFDVKPLSPSIGAEVTGLDLSGPLDAGTVAALRDLWLDHLVLLFRRQGLNDPIASIYTNKNNHL